MSGARPEQAYLSKDTDMSKTEETRAVIENMVDGLNDHRIVDIGEFFNESFRWMGNTGCGTKDGIRAFQDNWQKPFQAAFSEKVCIDEARLYMGEWAAAFGRQEAIHSGVFMGVKPTNKKIEELNNLLPHNGRWHTVYEEDDVSIIDGIPIIKKEKDSMT